MSKSDLQRSELSFYKLVEEELGIRPSYILGLPDRAAWVVESKITFDCPVCLAHVVLVVQRGRPIADAAVVCGACGWSEAVAALQRRDRQAVRSAFISQQPIETPTATYDEDNTHATDALRFEAELRNELRGRRLVCEISLDGARREIINQAFERIRDEGRANDPEALKRRYPATTAVFLASAAMHGYEAGSLWDHLPIPGLDGNVLGRAFERVLDELHLERFDAMVEGGAMRYVARILGHAGIPQYCCGDYFDLVLNELARGVDDATELISRIRLAPSRLLNVDKPVGRFLLYGGPAARDFLDRTIEMLSDWSTTGLADPARYGLPLYVCEALDGYDRSRHGASGRSASRAHPPRPTISIDPWDPSGPSVVLPPVPAHLGSGSWRISSGDQTDELRTSNLEHRTFTLPRSLAWNVDLVLDGVVARRSQFVGLAALNALVFDSSGFLLRDPTRVSAEAVGVLLPPDAELVSESDDEGQSAPKIIEEYPSLTGDWSGFSFQAVDVSALRRLIVRRQGTDRSCWVSKPEPIPALSGEDVDGVTTVDGLPVRSVMPDVTLPHGFDTSLWRIRITVDGTDHDVDLSASEQGVVSLASFVSRSGIQAVDIVGRGPLGSDFAARFVVVPGLDIDRPRRVVLPGHSRPALTVRADTAISIEGLEPGVAFAQEVRILGDRTTLRLADESTVVEIAVELPLLQWSLVTGKRRREMDDQPVRLTALDVVDDAAPRLAVRCGIERVQLSLELDCRGDVLYSSPTETTASEGRWVFDLAPAKDAIRAATTTISLRLRIGGMPVVVGHLRQDPGVAHVETHLSDHGDLDVRWSESRTVVDRVIRLWPLSRPWLGPTVVAVPDGATSEWIVDTTQLGSGAYLIEVAVDDGWSAPRRPKAGTPSTSQVVLRGVGSGSDDALDIVASALTVGRYSRPLDADEIDQHANELMQSLESKITLGPDLTTESSFRQTCEWLAGRPLALERALDDALSRAVDPDTLLALGIELARHMHMPNLAAASPALWAAAPVLAARLDLANGDTESRERIETYLGISDLEAWQPDETPVDENNVRVVLPKDAGSLRLFRSDLDAIPLHLLDPNTRQLAAFEWVINHQSGEFDAVGWVGNHATMIERLGLPDWAAALVRAEQVGTSTARAFPHARLPELVMRAAVLSMTTEDPFPRRALQRLRPYAPLIVTRSLVMATAVQAQRGE